MILPKSLLDQVEYYESSSEQNYSNGFHTRIVLHFKSKWRFRKVIKIRWCKTSYIDNRPVWEEPQDAVDLRQQLVNYFSQK